MPPTDYQASSLASFGRSILTIRREQVHAMDGIHDSPTSSSSSSTPNDRDLELFQKLVTDRFQELASAVDVLSLSWIRRLLDAFLACQEDFRAILLARKIVLSRPPLDRLISEFFDRTVKALDLCNATRDGVERIRQWNKHLEIVSSALGGGGGGRLGEGQFWRAKKALTDLAILMLDEKEGGGPAGVLAQRNRSFGRSTIGKDHHHLPTGHFRSLSWSVSRSWSAVRQLQAIGNNLTPPRNNEIVATGGIVVPVFTMNSVLLFVMWALVAAIPCQDRGLQTHFSMPRQFPWAAPILFLHERIMEEAKKRERKNSSGLLKEIHQIEKCTRHITELADNVQFPLAEERELEVRRGVEELAKICEVMREGLEPLQRQVREVFHSIVRSRTEGLDCLCKWSHPE